MANHREIYTLLNYFIAGVWISSGFICKVLKGAPRHETIVGRILGNRHARGLTFIIGMAEAMMGIWILTGIHAELNAVVQILIIAAMNALEFLLAPDLLLWGKANTIFAFMFILLIYYNQFYLNLI